jgi:hypothetical protein
MKKSITLLLIIIFVASCGNPQRKRKADWRQHRDSVRKAERLHPDSIISIRQQRWEKKKAHINAKFDSLIVYKDTIK